MALLGAATLLYVDEWGLISYNVKIEAQAYSTLSSPLCLSFGICMTIVTMCYIIFIYLQGHYQQAPSFANSRDQTCIATEVWIACRTNVFMKISTLPKSFQYIHGRAKAAQQHFKCSSTNHKMLPVSATHSLKQIFLQAILHHFAVH